MLANQSIRYLLSTSYPYCYYVCKLDYQAPVPFQHYVPKGPHNFVCNCTRQEPCLFCAAKAREIRYSLKITRLIYHG